MIPYCTNENYIIKDSYCINDAVSKYLHCITSAMMHYTINSALYSQYYITFPTIIHIINTALHYQCCITLSTLYYIINNALHHQRCIQPSMLYHSANDKLHHQRAVTHQHYIQSSTLHYIIELYHTMQSCTC